MTITTQTIITFAALIAAVAAILKYYNKVYDLIKHQQEQDKAVAAIKAEQTIIVYGVLACLKGLKEQGCDGPVTDAVDKLEKHLNLAAHDQL
jgi:Na+/H+ antiporter NhaD/arsenite permease-like protein